jgi:hypothetical protein
MVARNPLSIFCVSLGKVAMYSSIELKPALLFYMKFPFSCAVSKRMSKGLLHYPGNIVPEVVAERDCPGRFV